MMRSVWSWWALIGLIPLQLAASGIHRTGIGSVAVDFRQPVLSSQQINVVRSEKGLSQFRPDENAWFVSMPLALPLQAASGQVACQLKAEIEYDSPARLELLLRFSADGQSWLDWQPVSSCAQADSQGQSRTGKVLFVPPAAAYVEYLVLFRGSMAPAAAPVLRKLFIDFAASGPVPVLNPELLTPHPLPGALTGCGCPLPAYASRIQWQCPDGREASCAAPQYAPFSHISVETLEGSPAHWAASVRNLWALYTASLGYCDLPYHWLIDPTGVIYEGRGGGDDLVPESRCGTLPGLMRVAMLTAPGDSAWSPAARTALRGLLAWKACEGGIELSGISPWTPADRSLPVLGNGTEQCARLCSQSWVHGLIHEIGQQAIAVLQTCQLATDLDPDAEPSLRVYPNPARDLLTVEFGGALRAPAVLRLLDAGGRSVLVQHAAAGQSQARLACAALPAGLYLLQVRSASEWTVRKIQIE